MDLSSTYISDVLYFIFLRPTHLHLVFFNFSEVSLSATILILTEKAILYEGGLMYLLIAFAILFHLCLFRHSCCIFCTN